MIAKRLRTMDRDSVSRGRTGQETEFVVTCEHGGNHIPAAYRPLFAAAESTLKSHRGWDPGALRIGKVMSQILDTRLFFSKTSRLLIELNRSLGHRSLFSEFTASLPSEVQQAITNKYWLPYRNEVTACLDTMIQRGSRVIHLSVHSFTPVWEAKLRRTNIGLLYDPRRAGERAFCGQWKTNLRAARPDLVVHSNQPYQGKADGFTTSLRRRFDQDGSSRGEYIGVEIEINQAMIHPATAAQIKSIARLLCDGLNR